MEFEVRMRSLDLLKIIFVKDLLARTCAILETHFAMGMFGFKEMRNVCP